MRRQISVILFLAVLWGTSGDVLAKETTANNELAWLDSQECIEEFMQEASLIETEDNVYAFERISSVSPQMTRTRTSINIETYKTETLVLVPMEGQSSADLDTYLENIGTYSNTRSISGGNSYMYKWDDSIYIKGYFTIYYSIITDSRGSEYIKIDSLDGGYTGGGSGVHVESQEVVFGQSGMAISGGGYKSQSRTETPTGKTWSATIPSTWSAVSVDSGGTTVGANYYLDISRGTSTYTWTLHLQKMLVLNGVDFTNRG